MGLNLSVSVYESVPTGQGWDWVLSVGLLVASF